MQLVHFTNGMPCSRQVEIYVPFALRHFKDQISLLLIRDFTSAAKVVLLENEQMFLLDDWDYPEASKCLSCTFVFQDMKCHQVDVSLIHAYFMHKYVLVERLCMDDLKVMALRKMSSVLGENAWSPFSTGLEPEIIMKHLRTVYDRTRGDRR